MTAVWRVHANRVSDNRPNSTDRQTDWLTEALGSEKRCNVCNIFKVQSVPSNRQRRWRNLSLHPLVLRPQSYVTRQCPSDLHQTHSTHSTHTGWVYIHTVTARHTLRQLAEGFCGLNCPEAETHHLASIGHPRLTLCTFTTFRYNPILDETARNLGVIQWKCDNSSDMLCLYMTRTDM